MKTISKIFWFVLLFAYANIVKAFSQGDPPSGLRGQKVFMFVDPNYPDKHGVVAFVLPKGHTPDDYKSDMYGPYGFSNQITILGRHLYGRDTWGTINPKQGLFNLALLILRQNNPEQIILLAGVRNIFGFHPSPLCRAANFILVPKK